MIEDHAARVLPAGQKASEGSRDRASALSRTRSARRGTVRGYRRCHDRRVSVGPKFRQARPSCKATVEREPQSKNLFVFANRAIQIGRATRGVRHNVPQPLQTETRTGSVDKPLAEFASVQGRKTERSRPSQRRVEVVRVTGRPSASRGDQGVWQSAFFPVAAIRSAPPGNGLCNASASGVSASSHLPTSAGAVMIAGIALGAQGWHSRRS